MGGSGPYLTLFARAGISREQADADVAALRIHELASARGCTYVLPADDYSIGLALAQGVEEAGEIATAKKYLGVTEEEIAALCDAVVDALTDRMLDPAGLKPLLGDHVRNLGEAGKKRGLTTTLPLALGRLQATGDIRRVPVNGRLDQQRYAYARWDPNPVAAAGIGRDIAGQEIAIRYFRWIGPATLAQFQTFAGLTLKAARETVAPLGLASLPETDGLLLHVADLDAFKSFEPPTKPVYALVSGLDSLVLLRRDIPTLIDSDDAKRPVRGEKGMIEIGSLADLTSNPILDRGRIIGLWEYDPETESIAWMTFTPPTGELREAVATTEAFIRDKLGDARSFNLDSPASGKPRIDALRSAPT